MDGLQPTSCYNTLMKILLYTYDIMKIGGIETSFYNLAQFLSKQGHEVGVRYSVASPMQIKRYKDAGIDMNKVSRERCDVLLIGSVWKQPHDIIATVTVQQVHADWSDKYWKGAPQALNMLYKAKDKVDIFACVSESSASFVRRATAKYGKPVTVMYNLAPEKSELKKSKHKKIVFAAFTRMSHEKGLNNYQAFRKRIESLGIPAEFRVYTNGDAPEGWKLFEPVPDIKTEFKDVDFVCSLADTESFGYTIAEANSAGVPCVIKRANSTEEFFSAKENLILDDVTDFEEKDLRRKIKSYKLREISEKNILDAISLFESMQKDKCIIRSMRSFYDIESKVQRKAGDLFAVSTKRAKKLLSHELNIVERV